MAPTRKLLDKTTRLKRALLDFSAAPPLNGEVDRQLRAMFGANPPRDEAEFAFTMDSLLLDFRYSSGKTLVDHFVAAKPRLSQADRAMVLSWRNAYQGVFRVDAKEDGGHLTYNLADDMTYRVYSNAGPAFSDQITLGMFLLARIVPLENDWLFSGGQIPIPSDQINLAYDTAIKLTETSPDVVFQNPGLLELAWDLQRQEHANFIEFFGNDLVIFRRKEFTRRMDEYTRWRVYESRDSEGKTAADRSREQDCPVTELPPMPLPENMKHAETIGAIYDEIEGLMLFPDLGDLAAIFADPTLLEDDDQMEIVVDNLESPDILPIQRLAEQHPANANRIFQTILEEPTFEWARDGDAMLRNFKPFVSEESPLPSVHPIPEGLSNYRATHKSTGQIGRNDPCPCGSGRKFKQCHGKNAR